MIIRKTINVNAGLTQEQIDMFLKAKEMPIPDDAEYPELTDEELAGFKRASELDHSKYSRKTVCLRLSPEAVQIAESFGEEYVPVLSRIMENTLRDPQLLSQYR